MDTDFLFPRSPLMTDATSRSTASNQERYHLRFSTKQQLEQKSIQLSNNIPSATTKRQDDGEEFQLDLSQKSRSAGYQ